MSNRKASGKTYAWLSDSCVVEHVPLGVPLGVPSGCVCVWMCRCLWVCHWVCQWVCGCVRVWKATDAAGLLAPGWPTPPHSRLSRDFSGDASLILSTPCTKVCAGSNKKASAPLAANNV